MTAFLGALHTLLALLAPLTPPVAPATPGGDAPVEAAVPPRSEEALISLELLESDIRDALRLVAEQGNVNLVMSNDVQGAVTLTLRNASLEETLEAITNVGGFEYTHENGIVTVSTLQELLDRQKLRDEYVQAQHADPKSAVQDVLLIKLRYVDAERILSLVQSILSPTGKATLLKTADHMGMENTLGNQNTNLNPQLLMQQQANALQIGTRLESSSSGRPAKSHTLVVVDVPERLRQVREVVDQVDVKPLQILIEARFVEISLADDQRTGIDWNTVLGASGAAAPHTFPFGDASLGEFGPNVTGGTSGGVFPDAPNLVTTPGGGAGLFTFGTLDLSTFSAVLEMIERDARVQLVSNPRVQVGDRHTATILVGERYPIMSANISEFGTVTEQLDRYEPIGVQLEVTPSVVQDDEIELFVRPSTSSLGPDVEGSTGLAIARINSRQVDTAVTVRDRQTVVLGGLITSRESSDVSRVPFVGSVPVLGNLFTHTSTSVERVDLVIFLTVTIMREPGMSASEQELFEQTTLAGDGVVQATPIGERLEYVASAPQF